jgi:hypothetical protein
MATASLARFELVRSSAALPETDAARPRAVVDGDTRAALCLALTGLPLWAFTGRAQNPRGMGHPDHSPALETAARNWLCLS